MLNQYDLIKYITSIQSKNVAIILLGEQKLLYIHYTSVSEYSEDDGYDNIHPGNCSRYINSHPSKHLSRFLLEFFENHEEMIPRYLY